jgi:hypothetical protein
MWFCNREVWLLLATVVHEGHYHKLAARYRGKAMVVSFAITLCMILFISSV